MAGLAASVTASNMFSVQTTRFGVLSCTAEQCLEMAQPIIGFEQDTHFVLIPHASDSPFTWMQSLQSPELAFILTQPAYFGHCYNPLIPQWALDNLGPHNNKAIQIYTLVSIPDENPEAMTANFLAPIIIHTQAGKAAQVVLDNHIFNTRVHLLPQVMPQVIPQADAQNAKSA